jgi:putative DNA primase/helicase
MGSDRSAWRDVVGELGAGGLTREEVYARLNGSGQGLSRDVAEELAALSGAPARIRPAREAANAELTDLGNARRLVARHGDDLRYVPEWGRWLLWDGRRWVEDFLGAVMLRAEETVETMDAEAAAMQVGEPREPLLKHARATQSLAKLRAMVEIAGWQCEAAMRPGDSDADPWLFNVQNGTLDLRLGRLRWHRRENNLRKLAPVAYDPDAAAPAWEAFLHRIMGGDADLIRFLQRAVGYSLTADVSEQVLFFLYGTGKNGKSTFLNALRSVLGEYGSQAAPDLLLEHRGEIHPTATADLQGSRFVVASEVPEGRRMAEALVKQLTGGDAIKARRMRQDFYEFAPTHKLWLMANHKPVVRGADIAIWRRILLIPFAVTIPEDERDPYLDQRLQAEMPGILRWALEGCLLWQEEGLRPPQRVLAATEEYREEMDTLGDFIEERCTLERFAVVGATELYNAYKDWAQQNGENPMSQTAFGRKLADRGVSHDRGGPGRTKRRIGIALRNSRTS